MPPSASYHQPDHAAPVIQEFLDWLPKNYIKGTNGLSVTPNHPFMPLPDLQTYLKAEKRITKLLAALQVESLHQSLIETLANHYIRVFTILTLIGKGRYIDYFVQYSSLRDSKLPFLKKPLYFPIDPIFPTFWESFYEQQFTLCPHSFGENENDLKLEDPCILPIISKEVLAQGGSAFIYKIKLHHYYDELSPGVDISRAYNPRPPNTYVLKTYNTKDADAYYRNEVNAFMKLGTRKEGDGSLIKLLGSYRQGGTYNILLEYADRGTLEDFLRATDPPTLGTDIIFFWKRLFNVIKALQRIHTTERPDSFEGPDILVGWHQDVKPNNILVLSGNSNYPYDVEFKLADLGLSHFKRTLKLDRKIVDSDVGGTKDYGAPECDRSDEFLAETKLNVKRSIDIWSFGGVCSEAAVWVVLGMPGLLKYRRERKQEISERGTDQDGSCFHDGQNLLKCVKSTHQRLMTRGEVRPGDHITKPVLDHMVKYMLDEDPDYRDDAVRLWKKAKKIWEEAEMNMENFHPQIKPRESYPAGENAPDYGRNLLITPPHASYGIGQTSLDITPHTHGPPPKNRPRHSSNNAASGWHRVPEQRIERRSDTWHGGRNANSDVASLSFDESPSPSRENHPLIASPPMEERPELYGTTSNENPKVFEEPYPYADGPMPSSSGVFSDEHQSARDFPPPIDTKAPARFSLPPSTRQPVPISLRGNRTAFGKRPEHARHHSNSDNEYTGYINNQTGVADISSDKIVQQPPPELATIPFMTNMPSASTPVELPGPTTKPEKAARPLLSFDEAKKIRLQRGNLLPEHQGYLNDLKNRDHVFLIDDSVSMGAYWHEVISLFSVLAWIVKKLDDNGLEMYFTVSRAVKTFKDTTGAVAHLGNMSQSTYSNIDWRLQEILGTYQETLSHQGERRGFLRPRSKVKPLSLYVFTDGAWQGCDGIAPIEAMIKKQRQLGLPKEQVSVQFIRFGNHPRGVEKLEYLDSGLRKKNSRKWDIVDTEPFQGGNLLKMLLGATFDWFDNDGDDEDDKKD